MEKKQGIYQFGEHVIEFRLIEPADSIEELTELLHRSYKFLADLGFRFCATYQDTFITQDRIKDAYCFIGLEKGKMVATLTYYRPDLTFGTPWYDRKDVAHIGQFAVDPTLQRLGIGERLLMMAEEVALHDGVRELALDTAEGATHLIKYYQKRGFRFIEYTNWGITNYRSVVMSKTLVKP